MSSSVTEVLRQQAELEIQQLRERQKAQTLGIAQARSRARRLHAELARRVVEHRYYLECERRAGGPETEAAFSLAWDEAVLEWEGRFRRGR
jgi:hypothetical protein